MPHPDTATGPVSVNPGRPQRAIRAHAAIAVLALLTAACAEMEGSRPVAVAPPPSPAPPAAPADQVTGRATVLEGDVLEIEGQRVRLQAVDAPDIKTTTGKRALIELRRIVGREPVRCDLLELEPPAAKARQGWVGRCAAGGVDIGQELVRRGWARALQRYGDSYVIEEASARAAGRGMWPKPAPARPAPPAQAKPAPSKKAG